MTWAQVIDSVTDTYDRQARLYPALLAAAPFASIAIGIYGIPLEPKSSLLTLLATFGVVYLVTTVSREMGKRLEERLFAAWGGKPTTQLLRHRNQTIDSITKGRYHDFLSKKLNIQFPTRAQEQSDPDHADDRYASGARWLLDQTRDTSAFPLLFKELISYGFRRNCLGVRPIAIAIALLSIPWVFAAADVLTSRGIDAQALLGTSMSVRVVLGINLGLLMIWLFFFTKHTVRTAAFMYADLLLRACDRL